MSTIWANCCAYIFGSFAKEVTSSLSDPSVSAVARGQYVGQIAAFYWFRGSILQVQQYHFKIFGGIEFRPTIVK